MTASSSDGVGWIEYQRDAQPTRNVAPGLISVKFGNIERGFVAKKTPRSGSDLIYIIL
ncbi:MULTISPECIES: hypothetical protein [Rhodopseudomonas]|uniref:hypothetical protein n=1 Tax=Rhodopseudomonas TaxID=1073 RepID=UPI001364AC68|nr:MULTISPECIES: hypothetical protein [Rhodopseudomonas]MDF3810133.1 hypothetical protein [Rhodopseudomonas sp. BAL398]WOK18244.1 hypothetical protein RBJ75_01565 [Rhodopseudomonas sp. BAL398]